MVQAGISSRMLSAALAALLLASVAAGSAHAQLAPDARQAAPELPSGSTVKPTVVASRHMVVTANPYASQAGLDILRSGGSAVDATIAVQMVLGLVEPQSSGLGGGAFILHWDEKTHALTSIDGRETAPHSARPDRFLLSTGEPMPFDDVVLSPLSVGVPGVVRALELAHSRHGKLPWARLFDTAMALAENGFTVSPRLEALLRAQKASSFNPAARQLYFDDAGNPRAAGSTLTNPAYAATLRRIATEGAQAFYTGALPQAMSEAVSGALTPEDFAAYEAKPREPVCPPFRGYGICSMGPPSSGGITVGMVLGMLEARVAANHDHPTPSSTTALLHDEIGEIRVLIEAEKLAYADRDQYIADPDFQPQSSNLLNKAYLAARASLIDPARPMTKALPGTPPLKSGHLYGRDATREGHGTSHVSIVDDDGNAVSMTTTVQTAFGSGIMVGGFLLNSQLTDFSFRPVDASGLPVANRIEPGKRPRSSMAPTIILDAKGDLLTVLGSPGGSNIILYNLKSIVCLIEWHCSVQQAAELPTFGSRNGPVEVERGTVAEAGLGAQIRASGAAVSAIDMTSGLSIIERAAGELRGAADPRREGAALGD
jgi:gamma-glutamyltranspeptidase / glutathione hydrolase